MRLTNRIFPMTAILVLSALQLATAGENDSGWTFSQRFQGTSNAAGVVLKTNSTAIYSFNQHVTAYGGFPVYFVKATSSTGTSQFQNGLGNVFSGLVVTTGNSNSIYYSSNVISTFPTGDASLGFSTGHPTIDWTNTFSHSIGTISPYASIGVANTISDTSFFVRPFTSQGIVSHFELGAIAGLTKKLSVGASAYGVRAAGTQTIDSKVVGKNASNGSPSTSSSKASSSSQTGVLQSVTNAAGVGHNSTPPVFQTQPQTVGTAAIANDHGLSIWVSLRPNTTTDFQIGYSRSMGYQLNSLFFGVGFRFGHPVSAVN